MAELYTDINKITANLQLKADKDLSNITAGAKSQIAGYGMPSENYIDLTLGASGTSYTAPASGYFEFNKASSTSGQYVNILCNGISTQILSSASGQNLAIFAPAVKGAVANVYYSAGGSTNSFRFIYAEGENE